jgi:hypothetical protein
MNIPLGAFGLNGGAPVPDKRLPDNLAHEAVEYSHEQDGTRLAPSSVDS